MLLCMGFTGAAISQTAKVDRNVFISMRDTVRLATDIYMPVRAAATLAPIVLIRTPYNKEGYYKNQQKEVPLGGHDIVSFLNAHGYVVAIQDKRGRYNSEGSYLPSGGDANDGYDTVDWLSKQNWSNGKVGAIGCSYEGDVQLFMAGTKHPALKAIIPQASGSSVGSLGGYYRYFGVRIGGATEWVGGIGWFSQDGEKFFPRLSPDLSHDEYNAAAKLWGRTREADPIDLHKAWTHLPMKDALTSQGMAPTDFEDTMTRPVLDPYWKSLPYMTEQYTSDVPALFIDSWYDFGADMVLVEFDHFRRASVSQTARNNQFLIMSPHSHCEFERSATEHTIVGDLDVGDTRFDYRNAYVTWFDAWLKDDAHAKETIKSWPKVRYYSIGLNHWQSASDWPIPGTRQIELFISSKIGANSLNGDGRLLRDHIPTSANGEDTLIYDPSNPVPSRGGAMCCTGTPDAQPGALDQRPVESRSDVLVYTSDLVTQPTEVTGIPRVILNVSSDVVDTDFTAKLVDVYPDGRAFNILEGILRARYREGQEKEVWMKPGEDYELTISLGATSNVFLPGHRIRLELSSSNFPRFDRNLNLGGNNAEQSRWAIAHNTIHHSTQLRSRLVLPVVNPAAR